MFEEAAEREYEVTALHDPFQSRCVYRDLQRPRWSPYVRQMGCYARIQMKHAQEEEEHRVLGSEALASSAGQAIDLALEAARIF